LRKKNEQNIKDLLGDFVDSRPIKKGFRQTNLRKIWQERMGDLINRYTNDIFLVRNTLIVKLDSGPLRQELSYEQEKILKIFKEEFDMDFLEQVKFS